MSKPASEELRKQVWDALFRFKGDRQAAARALEKSPRTLNRYIAELDLYKEMDEAGMMANKGPPRKSEGKASLRETAVVRHIKKNKGELDYGDLAKEMYGQDNDTTRKRVYTTLSELKSKGVIANDGFRWFVVRASE